MTVRSWILSCWVMFSAISVLHAQQVTYLPLSVDYAVFMIPGDNNSHYLEVYTSSLQNSLSYVPTDSGFMAILTIETLIIDDKGETTTQSQQMVSRLNSMDEVDAAGELRHVARFAVHGGTYQLEVRFKDGNSGKTGEYLTGLEVREPAQQELLISDVQLAARISEAGAEATVYSKNGLKVIPNPSSLYSIANPVLYYYAEVYNLPYSGAAVATYRLESSITDAAGNLIKTFPSKRTRKPGTSAVLAGGHNVVALKSDTYFLNLELTDEESGASAESSKRFVFYKPSKEQLAGARTSEVNDAGLMSYLSGLPVEELDKEFTRVRYISTTEERSVYESLDNAGKARFLAEYWARRDNDRNTPENEYRDRYMQLLVYADENFTTKFRQGWESDRGRVLLVYGPPSEIERSRMERSTKPYEVWSYNQLEGGSIFVFADISGFGDYQLLHSSYSKELSQPDWERLILRRQGREYVDPVGQ